MTMPRNQDKDYPQRFGAETQSLHFLEHLIQEAMTSQTEGNHIGAIYGGERK